MVKRAKNQRIQERELLWGIDLGGTKIEGVVVHSSKPSTPISRFRIPTESSGGYTHILERIESVVKELTEQVGAPPGLIGLSHPGSIDPRSQVLRNSNTTCMNGKALVDDLVHRIGAKVVAQNDANCFTLAEATWGAGFGAKIVFGIILGTGCGGGIVIDGKLLQGAQGVGGEWGHNPLVNEGPRCYCGKIGCVEQVISGPALEQFYFSKSGTRLELKEIVARAEMNIDVHATATISRLSLMFGRALGTVANIIDPEVVVIGGGVSHIKALYSEGSVEFRSWIFHENPATRIVPNMLGDSAGVFGAAALCLG